MTHLVDLADPRSKYGAWVNNRVMALLMAIQVNRVKETRTLLKHEFFLEEIEHHFMDCHAGCRIWRAFRYLKLYLKNYPQKKAKRKQTALKMLGLIYEKLGFEKTRILNSDVRVSRFYSEMSEKKSDQIVRSATV